MVQSVADAARTSTRSFAAGLLLLGVASFIVAFVLADEIADLVSRVLPHQAEVQSFGTNYPGFTEVGPSLITRTGLVVGGAVVLAPLLARLTRPDPDDRRFAYLGVLVAAATSVWIGWLAWPHNGFPSNARIHWVDRLTWESDDFFYALNKVPHWIFYDSPWLWRSINSALIAWLFYLVARRLGLERVIAVGAATTTAISGNLLLFANTAEDVFLNLALILVVIYASLVRRPVLAGLAFGLVVLGRPPFILFGPAFLGIELLAHLLRRRPVREADWGYLLPAAVTMGGFVFVSQVVFSVLGNRWLFTNGRIVDTRDLADIVAREVDGFTISSFSGAYVGHFIWLIPLPLLVMAGYGLVRANRLPHGVEMTLYGCAAAIGVTLLLHEYDPLLYFNIRYLTYMFPFILTLAWSSLHAQGGARGVTKTVRVLMVVVVLLAPLSFKGRALDIRSRVSSRVETEMLEIQDELTEFDRSEELYIDFGGSGARNYLTYVVKGNVNQIKILGKGEEIPADGILVTNNLDYWPASATVASTEGLRVIDFERL